MPMSPAALPLLAFVAAFVLSLLLAPVTVRSLNRIGALTYHRARQDVDNRLFLELHQHKSGTPSMGGILMVAVTVAVGAVFFTSTEYWIFLTGFLLFAAMGLADDLSKVGVRSGWRARDLDARSKYAVQWLLAFLVAGLLQAWGGRDAVHIPGLGSVYLSLAYVPLAAFVIVCLTNAVNITDGLDGLAAGLSAIGYTGFLAIAVIRGEPVIAGICAVLGGTTLAFLFFNVHPARVFMGDVGSMALGVGLALVALLLDALVPLGVIAAVFLVEMLSSLVQIIGLRYGRRGAGLAPPDPHPPSRRASRPWERRQK